MSRPITSKEISRLGLGSCIFEKSKIPKIYAMRLTRGETKYFCIVKYYFAIVISLIVIKIAIIVCKIRYCDVTTAIFKVK